MSYRGEDLDLRTPQGRGARETFSPGESGTNGARPRLAPAPGGRPDALFVDDTVMACCNHAYDIALAHGAAEVRLEHLVHAMTRVEAAAEILEQRGIREAHLRRESAAVIASEIPVGLAHSHGAPRSSIEFEDVLRLASDQSRTRNSPATVHDLLWVLLNYNREIPAIALLLRHAADWQKWDWPHQINRREQPARAPSAYYAEPRRQPYVEPMPQPSRQRSFERSEPVPPPPAVQQYAPPVADLEPVYNRLEHLDLSLRKMQSDMANDRRALLDVLREVQMDIGNARAAGSAVSPAVVERLQQAVEDTVDRRLQDVNRIIAPLGERLSALEKSMTSGMQDGARNFTALSDRFKALDATLSANPTADLGDLVTEQLVAASEQMRAATEKIEALEARQREGHHALSGISETVRTLATSVAEQRGNVAGDFRGALETALPSGAFAQLSERVRALHQQFDQQNISITSAVAQVTEPLLERMKQLEALSESRQAEQAKAMTLLSEKSAEVATFVRTSSEQTAAAHQRDLTEMHDALLKLGTNQQTLAENLEQWRAENEGGISIVSNRLELLERSSAQPLSILQQLQTDMQGIQQVTLADYDKNRRGIRQWLFGTDDVFAGTWRDETAQIRARLRQIREERKI